MSSIYEKIDNRLETFLSTLKRFPLASFSAFLITIIMLVLVDYHDYRNPNAIMASKIAFVATLGVLLFPAFQLIGRSIVFPIAAFILLGIYYYILPQDLHNTDLIISIRHVLLGTALFCMILWAPFIFRKSDNDTFWQYAQSVIFGLLTAIFFSIIVHGGLAAALYAIEKLFHINVQSIRYEQLAIIVFGIFGVNFFLSQIPKYPLFLEVRPYSKFKRLFSKNILAPIAIVYFVILFTYTAKILINMTWPTGTLSWIIVAFSFVAIVSFLFLTPYLKKSTLTQRLIWLAIFLQTIMLGMALWMRVEEYGITYNRYLLALFGLWLALMSLYFMLFGKAQQKWLFFFASLFILFSQFGPYSAHTITKQSQTARLIKLIETADPRSEELDMKHKYEISDGLEYIEKHYSLDTFENIIPDILKKYKKMKTEDNMKANPYLHYNFSYFATKELGFKFINKWDWKSFQSNKGLPLEEDHHFYTERKVNSIDIKGYERLINYDYNQHMRKHPPFRDEQTEANDLNLSISFKQNKLTLKQDEQNMKTYDLTDYVKMLIKSKKSLTNIDQSTLTYENVDNNHTNIKILFQRLILSPEGNITDFSSQILLKP
ncbi:MAG: Unknown protein [uncultured Sulfurovum sp.]|uniref:DUF4153 domain-containing protein n=1 Tax=uncultured Sulfurovum sp. TaxID=269237 RepID=A0A6S6RZD0_9BACT|nr:MAG: Unknown protein [uncultured Sulfurovum sp.]